jgi:hypothetical protein
VSDDPLVVTVFVDSVKTEVTHHAGEGVALLTAYSARLSALTFGQAVVGFAQGRTKVALTRSYGPVPPFLPDDLPPAPAIVRVCIRGERAELTGQAAEAVALLTTHADALNRIPVGRCVIHFAHGRATIDMTESLPSVRLAPSASPCQEIP